MISAAGVADSDRLSASEARRLLRRTARWLRPHRRLVAISAALVVVWTATQVAGPALVRHGIDRGLIEPDRGVLRAAVLAYVAVAVVAYVAHRTLIVTLADAGERFLRDLRVRVFRHLEELPLSFFDRHPTGVLVSRMTSDIDSLTELVQTGLLMFVANALLLVVTIAVLLAMSPLLLLVCLVGLPGVVVASRKFQRDSNRSYLRVRDRIGGTLAQLQEGLSGVRVVQAHAREDLQADRFEESNRELYDAHMDSVRVAVWYLPVIELAGIGTTAVAVGIGGWMAQSGRVSVGTVAAFVLLLGNLFDPVQQLSQLFNVLQSAGAGLRKLFELLDTEADVADRPGAFDLPAATPVELDGVSFAYGGGPPVLSDIDLVVADGERLAVVGPTGAGKSTLAKLVARFHDPTAGRVQLGGADLRDVTRSSLRRAVVTVPQEGFLFWGTVRDNVRIARPGATDDEVDAALARLGMLERFRALPDGLDTEVRERGSRLSAGERQLVSLGRAALADPDLLVLDEATSSLDPGTEAAVERALARLLEGRTAIVIAHRLSTAERADRVAVVDEGRLVELGSHAELVDRGGRYAELFEAWRSGVASAAG